MTAIVGVLNKHAIAVAADSAETVGGGLKIYDKANKIFTLSKHHPVGIAIYNNAAFNSSIPWEIIIKMYRRLLEDKSFDALKDYLNDFFDYLEQYQSKYLNTDDLNVVTSNEIAAFWITEIVKKLPSNLTNNTSTITIKKTDLSNLESMLVSHRQKAIATPKIPALSTIDLSAFITCINKSFLKPAIEHIVKVGGEKAIFEPLISETLYEIFTRQYIKRKSYSGLAFFGYGEKEIYPSLIEELVYNSFAGQLYHQEKSYSKVQNQKPTALIHPMAQTDVMKTYIEGISPQIEATFVSINEDTMRNFLKELAKALKPTNPSISATLSNVDLSLFSQSFRDNITEFKRKVTIGPLMDTVATMEKEDLAELAENLIYLTSLKRRITPNLESVGGPVDVAIVSKGDGFIWLKRKHYFNPELNRYYFDKYF